MYGLFKALMLISLLLLIIIIPGYLGNILDSESYENHTLYVLTEDMEDEWAKNKNTEYTKYNKHVVTYGEIP